MTPEQINIAIEKACGFEFDASGMVRHPESRSITFWPIPDYHGDLNACAEMEATLTEKLEQNAWAEILISILNRDHDGEFRFIGASAYYIATATAPQRCEAFLRTKGLWK